MENKIQPKAEANKISKILDISLGLERYPVDVKKVAIELSISKFPNEPISDIRHESLGSFQGALIKHPKRSKWMIVYNNDVLSHGRIRFTLAHEFGHYILHRKLQTEFHCSDDKYELYDQEQDAKVESEADMFASFLLMPLHDFRSQTENEHVSMELLMHCANRYDVSLMAAALQCKNIMRKRVVVVAARDGFLLWASSNTAAYKSGAYLSTKKNTIPVPKESLINKAKGNPMGESQTQSARLWFPNEPIDMPITEHVFVSKNDYEYTLCLIVLPDAEPNYRYKE